MRSMANLEKTQAPPATNLLHHQRPQRTRLTNRNCRLDGFSDKVEVDQNAAAGRFIVATEDIKVNVLYIEPQDNKK